MLKKAQQIPVSNLSQEEDLQREFFEDIGCEGWGGTNLVFG